MTEPQRCDHWDICYFRCGQIGRCIENDKQGCQFALHSSAKSDAVLEKMSQLCAYLHYSHTENERMMRETKNRVAREILKGRMFEDCMILDALEELRVKGKIELRSQQKER